VEHHLLQNLTLSKNIQVDWEMRPTSLKIDESQIQARDAYPVTVALTKCVDEEGDCPMKNVRRTPKLSESVDLIFQDSTQTLHVEEVRAKYVVGCDGAHSWTRTQLGVTLEGDLTDSVFGLFT
jgi:phenol 2-monooxygenase (NADPH)